MDQRLTTLLAIGLGGFFGANARYVVSIWLGNLLGRSFPWGTFLINVSGSFILAVFVAWTARQTSLNPALRLAVAVGFFGAYTTFSTFANETVALFQTDNWGAAVINIVGTNLICILAVVPGLLLGSRL